MKLNAENNEIFDWMGTQNGERPAPFSFVQLSDTHVGFNGHRRGEATVQSVELGEVELSLREFSGTEGIQQILRAGVMA